MPKKPSLEIQNKALGHVTAISTEYRTMSEHLRDKWLRFYELYRLFKEDVGMPWQSKLFIARIFEVVEKIAPRMTSHNPSFTVIPKKKTAGDVSEKLAAYLDYVWEEERLKKQIRLFAKNMLIYGKAIAKIDWHQVLDEEEALQTVQDEFGNDVEVPVTEAVIQGELPRFEVVDIFDFLIDPRDSDIDSGTGVIHKRDTVDFKELLANKDMYFNLDQVQDRLHGLSARDDEESEQQSKFDSKGITDTADKADLNKLAIKEYWGRFSESGEPEDEAEYVITTVNDSIVIRLEKNPYGFRPFVAADDMSVPGEFYGIGEVEPLESLQVELNWLRNQRMDNVNLALNKMWLVDNNSGVSPSQLVSRPGNIIFKNPNTVIQAVDFPDVTSSSYQEEQQIGRDIQTISGTIDTTDRGGDSGFTNTATGQRIRSAEQNARFQAKIENLEEAIVDIGKKMLILTEKFADQNIIIRKLIEDGETEFVEITKEEFQNVNHGFSVRVETGSTAADTSFDRRNDSLALFNLGLTAMQAGVPVNITKLWTDVLQKGFGFKNPAETLNEEAPGVAPGQQVPPELAPFLEETPDL